MTDDQSLIIVSADPDITRRVREVAQHAAELEVKHCYHSMEQLPDSPELAGGSAAVVDLDPDPAAVLSAMARLSDQSVNTRFIAITGAAVNDWMLEAMQAGARHLMSKEHLERELPTVLQRLLPARPAERKHPHRVITVLSAGGGCGGTTVAVNLAVELERSAAEPVLLVDLDSCFGGAAGYLGLEAKFGIADVLADEARIDAHLIASTSVHPDGSRLSVLASPATVHMEHPAPLKTSALPRTLRSARDAYPYTVIDAPRMTLDLAADLARASELTIIVLESNVEDVRVARRLTQGLVGRGLQVDRLLVLVNRFERRGAMIGWSELQELFAPVNVTRLPNDYRHAAKAINYGKSLAEIAPRSRLRREIRKVAGIAGQISRNGKHHR